MILLNSINTHLFARHHPANRQSDIVIDENGENCCLVRHSPSLNEEFSKFFPLHDMCLPNKLRLSTHLHCTISIHVNLSKELLQNQSMNKLRRSALGSHFQLSNFVDLQLQQKIRRGKPTLW